MKVLFTCVSIIGFLSMVLYADVFGTSVQDETRAVNSAFLGWEDEENVEINLDSIVSISDEGENSPIISYIVQPWDTLEKISKEFWVPIKDLKRLNKIGDKINPWQKLIVSDDEEGILYVVKKERSIKLFAEFYRLDLQDLMTLNYISDDSEILYPGQEIFINVTEKRAYDIGLLEKEQPVLPKDEIPVTKKPTKPKTTSQNKKSNGATVNRTPVSMPQENETLPDISNKKSKIIKKRYYNPKISNGFAVGYCTWYAAIKSPWIFKYTSETKQDRSFGGNAKDWYNNAKKAGYNVGQTPRVGAIIVYKQLRSSAGHVGIVKAYYPESGEMIIEDMNYAGKFVVTQRWDSTSNSKIIGYIYP